MDLGGGGGMGRVVFTDLDLGTFWWCLHLIEEECEG